ncbi:uncharacterized protein LOC135224624 [Macrobrachium nipponense]|uniref:uncharacterized protein LOC135224624 n=1 Tax=Macrobrachium nipponense TaxID=159736 RepID=UPI0030C7C727
MAVSSTWDGNIEYVKKNSYSAPSIRKHTLWSYYFEGNVENPEICIESLNLQCPYEKECCSRLHAKKRWHWQILHNNEWYNLLESQSDRLERSFQFVDKDGVVIPAINPLKTGKHGSELINLLGTYNWKADFQQMKISQVNGVDIFYLRRLSTPSAGKSKDKYASNFKWFRQENESWIEFGQCVDLYSDSTQSTLTESPTTSHAIEKQYQKNESRYMTVNVFHNKAKLNFLKMELTYKKSRKVVPVRRRPVNDDVVYPTVWFYHPTGHVEIPEICTNTIEDKCAKTNGCGRLHSNAVWQWQFMHEGIWYNLPRVQKVAFERAFLDVWEDTAEMPAVNPEVMGLTGEVMVKLLGTSKWLAEFDSMTMTELNRPGTTLKIRRLSTPSTVKSGDDNATNFVWFFQKDFSWVEFGCAEETNVMSSSVSPLSSSYGIEKCYESQKWDTMEVSVPDGVFELNFNSMKLKHTSTQEEIKVRRRPECARSGVNHFRTKNQVELSATSKEFGDVRRYLFRSLKFPEIVSIKRVQNPQLWAAFKNRQGEVSSDSSSDETLNIHTLFHWVEKNLVDKICSSQFEWIHQCQEVKSQCEQNVVFFRSAEFHHTSCPSPSVRDHRLLVFKVLAGNIRTSTDNSHTSHLECSTEVDNEYLPERFMKDDKRDYCLEYIVEL